MGAFHGSSIEAPLPMPLFTIVPVTLPIVALARALSHISCMLLLCLPFFLSSRLLLCIPATSFLCPLFFSRIHTGPGGHFLSTLTRLPHCARRRASCRTSRFGTHTSTDTLDFQTRHCTRCPSYHQRAWLAQDISFSTFCEASISSAWWPSWLQASSCLSRPRSSQA